MWSKTDGCRKKLLTFLNRYIVSASVHAKNQQTVTRLQLLFKHMDSYHAKQA